jgi:hypothetical protein
MTLPLQQPSGSDFTTTNCQRFHWRRIRDHDQEKVEVWAKGSRLAIVARLPKTLCGAVKPYQQQWFVQRAARNGELFTPLRKQLLISFPSSSAIL